MKRMILLGAFALISVVGAQAQTNFGIKVGLNVANIGGDAKNTDPRTGVHAGFFATAPISDRFAIQPEVLYSQQGYKSGKSTFTLHYLNIPLIFKGTISGGFHLQVGPQFGILLDAKQKVGNTTYDISDNLNKYDGAVALGLGYDLSRLQVSARYNLGLSDIADGNIKGESYPNNVFQLSVGVKM
ncbi:outer membrane beta-barrel protein [Nibribacter ruber]|uniref:Outer membrane beta-barrel protein n=1 Tax=Nibribacter ruber TaxID=2698458 RepID=A0A6P1P1F3_9BACT|nr:porin family protein [Nibribacter ruber]QHL87142.1 outer membrane beta-barrel protein [Nibribacter ruber]